MKVDTFNGARYPVCSRCNFSVEAAITCERACEYCIARAARQAEVADLAAVPRPRLKDLDVFLLVCKRLDRCAARFYASAAWLESSVPSGSDFEFWDIVRGQDAREARLAALMCRVMVNRLERSRANAQRKERDPRSLGVRLA